MLLGKVGYLCLYGGLGFLVPFMAVLLNDKGFSPASVGILTAVQPIASLLILPALSLHADRTRSSVRITTIAVAFSCLFALIFCGASSKSVVACGAVGLAIAMTPIPPFFDDHTMGMLEAKDKSKWGNLRVFGAYGWGIAAPVSSYLFGHYGWIYAAIGFSVLLVGMAYCMISSKDAAKRDPTEKRYGAVLKLIANDRSILAFVMGACFMGMGYILIGTFLFIFLKNELQAPDLLLGISISLTVAVEIPFMAMSGKLHERFTDAQLFTAASLGWVVRVVGYSLLTNPWYVLVLEPLHGFSFALMWLSSVHSFSQSFPKDLSATAFGVLHASVFGFGPIVGNIIGGILYDSVGPRKMYRIMSAAMLLMIVAFWVLLKSHVPQSLPEEIVSTDMTEEARRIAEEEARHHELEMELELGSVVPVASSSSTDFSCRHSREES